MYLQSDRPIQITTPLGADSLFLTEFRGHEAISELFRFELDVVAELQTEVPFDQLLGKGVTVKIQPKSMESGERYFNGIVRRVAQGERDQEFTHYRMELVPQFWLLTRNVRSRIFQQKTTPDILKLVFDGLDVSYEIQGIDKQREYCVQYAESDFNFACRLMEEEGIYYYFKHSDGSHTMVVANTPQSHQTIAYCPTVKYEQFFGNAQEDERVFRWFKGQEIRTSKYTVWDEHFQLPGKHLDKDKDMLDSVQVGKTSHKLKSGSAGREMYEFPGEYSRHFDGINKSGGEQPSHLQYPFDENSRIVDVRIQQEAVGALRVDAASSHAAFSAGFKFTLEEHFSDDGEFVLTAVDHEASQPMGTMAQEHEWNYENRFSCIPSALPFRPQRNTPIPSVRGVQLATVVGPPGEEIFTDKYGRVKVQFHWDREGKMDLDSSCWIRVATFWAGKQWGGIHLPRIGHEVIVDFEEGDVDHPIIVGSVYNADNMVPYKLPDNKTQAGVKSRSTKKGTSENFNEIRMEDKIGSEELYVHAEKDLTVEVEHDETRKVDNDRTTTIGKSVGIGNDTLTVNHDLKEKIMNSQTTEAITSIEIKCGTSSIKMDPASITIKAMMIKLDAQVQLSLHAPMVDISGDAMTTIKGGIVMIN